MQDPKIKNLPIDDFDKLAHEQSRLFPDLLLFRSESEIIDDFYNYYGRKKTINLH
jgi:hypothetical protein